MKIVFTISFDTETGEYESNTKGIEDSTPKTKTLLEIADSVSAMFIELSKKYYKRILKEDDYITKKEIEEMN
jgi:hypothetical protein